MTWTDAPRWLRLLLWACRLEITWMDDPGAPPFRPTLRQAWTGADR